MITSQERDELARKAREDGKRLFRVVEGIYKYLIAMNWVVAAIGTLIGAVYILKGVFQWELSMMIPGIFIVVMTGLYCSSLYVFAVLITHGAKVLVHILFSNLAIMESKQS
jgi:predicted branched-subunit amino acid permease